MNRLHYMNESHYTRIMNIIFGFLLSMLNLSCLAPQEEHNDSANDLIFDTKPLSMIVTEHQISEVALDVMIDKSEFKLYMMHADTVVKWYPVVLGHHPVGDKMQEGDKKTPEGVFGIRDKYPHKSWKYFIWIDYPNEESWKRFEQRKKEGVLPSEAKIGGEVGIHGTPEGGDYLIDEGVNWTFGCISLKRSHIDEIYPYFHKNIKITIQQ